VFDVECAKKKLIFRQFLYIFLLLFVISRSGKKKLIFRHFIYLFLLLFVISRNINFFLAHSSSNTPFKPQV
jgi:hypothetical protein